MSDESRVTVVIPTIPGRQDMLLRAISSVDNQTVPCDFVVSYDEHGAGAATTRNKALASVDTEFLAWLDDDDELFPNHVELALEVLDRTGADLAFACMEVVGGRDPLATAVDGKWVNPCGIEFGPEQESHLRQMGNFIPVTYVVRTELVRKVGGMPQPWSIEWPRDCEDYGLLIRLLDAGATFVHVPHITWRYHIHGANTGGGTTRFQ